MIAKKKRQRQKSRLKLLMLVRGSGLYLLAYGEPGEQTFAQVFQMVWHKIPLRARQKMVAYWRTFRDELRNLFGKADNSLPKRLK